MRPGRLLTTLLILCALVTPRALASDSGADSFAADDAWVPPANELDGFHGIMFSDQAMSLPYSYLRQDNKLKDPSINPTCTSLSDASCNPNETKHFVSVFHVCQGPTDKNCIETLEAVSSVGVRIAAQKIGSFPEEPLNSFKGSVGVHLPDGASSSIWSIPSAPHAGGDTYLLSVAAEGNLFQDSVVASIQSFDIVLAPVKIIATHNAGHCQVYLDPKVDCFAGYKSGYQRAHYANIVAGDWISTFAGSDGIHNCVDRDQELCAQKFSFPSSFRFSVRVRTNALPVGWLHGRMANPEISITEQGNQSILQVEAGPVRVPVVSAGYLWKDLPATLKALYNVETGWPINSQGHDGEKISRTALSPEDSKDPLKRNGTIWPLPSGDNGIAQLKAWLPFVSDKATSSNSLWTLRTLRDYEKTGANKCFDSDSNVTGIVTTNSTEYSAGPPLLNALEGKLTYSVSAPHFLSNGTVFKGNYDLVMRSDVARCVYKFSNAPVSASVEIISEDGAPQVATTTVGEKNGWLHLSANEFTYSSPTVKVKLEQAKVEVPVVPAAIAVTPVPALQAPPTKRSITCINGKNLKKVTAVNPKCPLGYKLK